MTPLFVFISSFTRKNYKKSEPLAKIPFCQWLIVELLYGVKAIDGAA